MRRAGFREAAFTYGEHGKPYLNGFCFNLSHSGTLAVLAVADGEVGVDVEKIAAASDKLICRVCTGIFPHLDGEGERGKIFGSGACLAQTSRSRFIMQRGEAGERVLSDSGICA